MTSNKVPLRDLAGCLHATLQSVSTLPYLSYSYFLDYFAAEIKHLMTTIGQVTSQSIRDSL